MPFFYVAYTTIIFLHNLIEAVNAMAMIKDEACRKTSGFIPEYNLLSEYCYPPRKFAKISEEK